MAFRWREISKAMRQSGMCWSFCRPATTRSRTRRYPVVYALHGYSIGAQQWSMEIHVPQTIEGAFAKGAREMIVVLPDSKTVHNGSMYSSSVTTGRFREFHCPRPGELYRCPLPHDPEPRGEGVGWTLHGRLWRHPHRHETSRCFRQSLHHEPVLPVSAPGRPDETGGRGGLGVGQDAGGL